jgi:hypothetical protein
MPKPLSFGVANIGNNILALLQGIACRRKLIGEGVNTDEFSGTRFFKAGHFALQKEKIGSPIEEARLVKSSNYPDLGLNLANAACVQELV